jgi:hypothetical protein
MFLAMLTRRFGKWFCIRHLIPVDSGVSVGSNILIRSYMCAVTNLLASYCRNLAFSQLVKKFSRFCGNLYQDFIETCTSLTFSYEPSTDSYPEWDESSPHTLQSQLRSIIILSSLPSSCHPSRLFPSDFLGKPRVCSCVPCDTCHMVCQSHCVRFGHSNNTGWS